MSDEFLAQFPLETALNVTLSSNTSGTEVQTGPLKMVNAWGLTVAVGTRPRPTFYPWHRVQKIEKA